ncbi:STAS domain-containing protein [Humisphaera borealis]|uniref:Anti-sigma factor antagonist n=1 Tax=Humisphaera borealis TaxID=2807512 RepID=A0A7M2WPJ6_9BACT|nr:STAS domain-containing protein [Humisphaera borealis]QOV87386.1 anti-sigma factor antagonist [Humisphaera borealis]
MSHDWFAVSQEGVVQVLALAVPFHVDSADFDRLHDAIMSAVEVRVGSKWVIDLAGLHYMGSSVLGLMVNLRQRVRQGGGKLVLCGMNPKLHQVFRTCSLEKLFVIRTDRDDAVEAVTR